MAIKDESKIKVTASKPHPETAPPAAEGQPADLTSTGRAIVRLFTSACHPTNAADPRALRPRLLVRHHHRV